MDNCLAIFQESFNDCGCFNNGDISRLCQQIL